MLIKNQTDLPPTWCLISGDNHGIFGHLVDAAKRYKPQFILSVGDVEPQRPLVEELAPIEATGCKFLFVHGNHESDRAETWEYFQTASDRNMHGRVVQVGDLKVAFLGGVFRQESWYPPQTYKSASELFASVKFDTYQEYVQHLKRKTPPKIWDTDEKVRGLLRKHRTSIFPSVYRALLKQRANTLISHEAGAWAHHHGFQCIDDLRSGMGAMSHFFGHHHARRFRKDARRAISVGVGLRGITSIDGSTIIRPGDLDRQRAEPLCG
jgi:calcineurin-like phosphoesterase family protein